MKLVLLAIFDEKLNFDPHFILFPQFSSTKELNVKCLAITMKERKRKKSQINMLPSIFEQGNFSRF